MVSAVAVLRHASRREGTDFLYAGMETSRPAALVLSGPACLKRYFDYGPWVL